MSADLFSAPEPVCDSRATPSFSGEPCALCISAAGEYNWGNVCCRARFVTGLPGIDWRREWMAYWRHCESSDFYSAIEQTVKTLWDAKIGALNV
jgi:hypothetical protein